MLNSCKIPLLTEDYCGILLSNCIQFSPANDNSTIASHLSITTVCIAVCMLESLILKIKIFGTDQKSQCHLI
jgi:hypothetical protein